jgi:hypothetical protein
MVKEHPGSSIPIEKNCQDISDKVGRYWCQLRKMDSIAGLEGGKGGGVAKLYI